MDHAAMREIMDAIPHAQREAWEAFEEYQSAWRENLAGVIGDARYWTIRETWSRAERRKNALFDAARAAMRRKTL